MCRAWLFIVADEQKFVLKMPMVTRSNSKGRPAKLNEADTTIANEMKSIKEMLTAIKDATEANTAEIAVIKSLSTQTEANVKKVSEQNDAMNKTPIGPAMKYVQNYRARSFANVVAAATPKGAKRPRPSSPAREKMQFPAAKVGMKSNVNGLSVVPKVIRSRETQPKFEKALYVSRLSPSTTNEALSDYIVACCKYASYG